MTTAADLLSAADLCNAAAQAALAQQQNLPPCPIDAAGAHAWTQQNSSLQHNINSLTNLSSSFAAQAVSAALDAKWPALQGLAAVTASAKADIQQIVDVGQALTTLAAVISFGVAVAALIAAPNAATANTVLTAFNTMKGDLSPAPAAAGAAAPANPGG
ncbi:MAG TPA: hypothetical protein VGG92_08190 [Caulobacteraceae bacterium]|jgi:hypothetical protein